MIHEGHTVTSCQQKSAFFKMTFQNIVSSFVIPGYCVSCAAITAMGSGECSIKGMEFRQLHVKQLICQTSKHLTECVMIGSIYQKLPQRWCSRCLQGVQTWQTKPHSVCCYSNHLWSRADFDSSMFYCIFSINHIDVTVILLICKEDWHALTH